VSSRDGPVRPTLSPDPGTQLLLSLDSMGSPLVQLPSTAYDPLIVVSSDSPADVAERVTDAGADLGTVGHIPISGSEIAYEGRMWVCDPLVPDDLTGLSMRLSRAFEALGGRGGWLLVTNLNVFLLYAAENRVIRFLDYITELAAEHGITGVYALVEDAVDPSARDRLRLSVDAEFDGR